MGVFCWAELVMASAGLQARADCPHWGSKRSSFSSVPFLRPRATCGLASLAGASKSADDDSESIVLDGRKSHCTEIK